MPTMANITVKNAANADVVYNAATASAGDRSPAIWRVNAAQTIIGLRPKFSFVTRDNARGNARLYDAEFHFPVVGTDANSNPVLLATVPLRSSGTLPTNVDAAVVKDAFVQFGNLLVSTLIRSAAEEGYAPT